MSLAALESPPAPARSHLRPRRTLNRLALALLAVGLAAAGQFLLGRASLWDGLLFYTAAAILFSLTLAHRLDRPAAGALPAARPALATGWRRNVGLWLVLVAAGCSALGFSFFAAEETYPQGWWLYLAGLLLLIPGSLLLAPAGPAHPRRLSRPLLLALAGIMAVAVFMRLFHFYSQPFGIWYDEAEAGLQARQMLHDPAYRPVFYAPINLTGHLLALYALALEWLGDNVQSMRLVSVLFGLAGVAAAYLFGRELHGPRFGLVLAFLLAVARWHVNFSRIAMTGVDTTCFEFLSLYFLVRLLRYRQPRDALAAGLVLGLGLMFYTAFRLYLVALGLFGLVGLAVWWPWPLHLLRRTGWRRGLAGLALLGLAIWLVVMPVVRFARDNPDAFWYRTNQISILNRRDQPDLALALWTSAEKHLLMFNFEGDNNGRHNLPGAPMLDPVTGLLAVLGFGLALARPRRAANLFFLILFPVALTGGIFSVDFEAPQSLRSIAVLSAVIYFAGLAVLVLGREAEEALAPLPLLWTAAPAAAVAGLVLFLNGYTYFVRQASDFASWNAFSAPETITGYKMAELGAGYKYFLSPFLTGHPTVRFLAPNVVDQRPLLLPDALPIREPADRPVALFIHPDDAWIFEEAQRLYPNAGFEVSSSPVEDVPVVYLVTLQPADLASVQGLTLSYRPAGAADEAPPLQAGRAPHVEASWPADLPATLSGQEDLVAEWIGVLYAPRYGPYSFRLATPGAGQLEIDGNPVLDGQGEQLTGLPLAQGNHSIRVQAAMAPGQVRLSWQPPGQGEGPVPQWALYSPPVTNHGLLGKFYANDRWEGQPVLQRIDPFLDLYFHLTPLNRPYSVEWTGSLDVPQAGVYRLGLQAVHDAQLYLDGQSVVGTVTPNESVDTPLTLQPGLHPITVRFRDTIDRSRIHLYWTRPDGEFQPVPSQFLWPPLGRYPPRPASPAAPAASPAKPVQLDWLVTLGQPGTQPGQFLEPRDVAVTADGRLVVADTGNKRVQILDAAGRSLQVLTGDPFPFEEPLAVGVNSRGEILVLDSTLQWVYRYSPAGELLNRFGGPSAYLFHPRGMTVLDDDTVVLADTGSARLAFFGPSGAIAGALGGLGSGPGQFKEPTDVLRDGQGIYTVVEAENNRIQQVDASGNPLGQWAIPPAYAYDGPHLAFGPDGSLFMTDSQSHSLLRYGQDGTLLNTWPAIGPANLAAPVGLFIDPASGRLYITDVRTHQLYVFSVHMLEK